MAAPPKQWGVTGPISTALPQPDEIASNDALIEELKRQNNFEAVEQTEKRHQALKFMEKVAREFIKEAMTKKGKPQSIIEKAGGKVSTYGSYRLGVFGPGASMEIAYLQRFTA